MRLGELRPALAAAFPRRTLLRGRSRILKTPRLFSFPAANAAPAELRLWGRFGSMLNRRPRGAVSMEPGGDREGEPPSRSGAHLVGVEVRVGLAEAEEEAAGVPAERLPGGEEAGAAHVQPDPLPGQRRGRPPARRGGGPGRAAAAEGRRGRPAQAQPGRRELAGSARRHPGPAPEGPPPKAPPAAASARAQGPDGGRGGAGRALAWLPVPLERRVFRPPPGPALSTPSAGSSGGRRRRGGAGSRGSREGGCLEPRSCFRGGLGSKGLPFAGATTALSPPGRPRSRFPARRRVSEEEASEWAWPSPWTES